ncbi:MAG: SDR family oxidoreductase [Candidatus Hydrogenedentota bacterium]
MKVIITGSSGGIGRGIATYLAMDGFDVGLLARSRDSLEDLRQTLEEQGARCFSAACDLRDPDQTEFAIAALIDGLGGVNALVNNAGIVTRKNVFDLTIDEWQAMVETNVSGLFYATKSVLSHMKAQRQGHIINISSISGKVPLPGGSGYAATKFAVTGFSQSLFHEVREFGIKVTTVYPGSVDSASHRHDPMADSSWKVTPEQVGQVCRDVLKSDAGTVISEVEIRPLRKGPG